MKWIRKEITFADIAIIIFMVAGFYYTTNFKFASADRQITRTEEKVSDHLEYQFRPLREQVKENSDRIIRVEGNYENIRKLLEQQKKNQDDRFNSIESQLQYIINRLDND